MGNQDDTRCAECGGQAPVRGTLPGNDMNDDCATCLATARGGEDFDAALDGFIAAYTKLVADEHTRRGWTHEGHRFTFETDNRAVKYVRVTQTRVQGGSKSVYAFVRRSDGAIMYPAGYRGPVTKPHGVRGNIYSADHGISCCGPFGMKTLR